MSAKMGSADGSPQWHLQNAEFHEAKAAAHRQLAASIKAQRAAQTLAENAKVPVDRTDIVLTSGAPLPDDGSHLEIRADGMQSGYVVLSEAERAKGFVRPYRDAYRHVGVRPEGPTRPLTPDERERFADVGYVAYEPFDDGHPRAGGSGRGRYWTQAQLDSGCGQITTMARSIAETYARDPAFYGATFCTHCGAHYPVGRLGQFTWYEMDGREGPKVGT